MKNSAPQDRQLKAESSNRKQEIKYAFKTFDTNKNGTLDKQEFRFALRALGFEQSKARTEKYFDHYKCGDEMSYECFAKIVEKQFARVEEAEYVSNGFEHFDFDKDGKINVKDLLNAFHLIGQDVTQEEVEKLIDEFDEDGDKALSYKEFGEIFFPTK